MHNWAIATIATRNYLHFARTLASSVKKIHPDVPIIVCLVDEPPAGWERESESFQTIRAAELGIPHWRRFLFQYNAFELVCALKSYLLLHLLRTTGSERLFFLDGDIALYSTLTPLLDALDDANIILTPQMAAPRSVTEFDRWEADVLDTGAFNIGFLGLCKTEPASRMLNWWETRVAKYCKFGIGHYEQGWLDAVPALFDGVRIERGASFNLTPQNLHHRIVTRSPSGQPLVDGQPLCFFHFVGIDPCQSGKLSRASRRPLAEEPAVVQELYQAYVGELRSRGLEECRAWGYQYATLADGTPIPERWRELIRLGHPALAGVEDPFAVPASTFMRLARKEKVKQWTSRAGRMLKRMVSP